jgi:beta-lactamase superfamily II metal-dependent hydrolase
MRSLLATMLAVALAAAGSRAADKGELEIEWIDVEGGAATLIVTPARETILVDAGWPGFEGRDAARIKAALEKRGLKAIDHFITSHFHVDHFGGVPQLAEAVPVRKFYDHGPMTELAEDRNFPDRYKAYRAAAKDATTTLKPGDTIGLRQAGGPKLSLSVVAARGQVVSGKAQPQNPVCAESVAKPEDPSDNARSIAFLLKFGNFEFFDAGDLTWNVEAQLVCPADRVGRVDLYQVTHHGMDTSNNVVVLKTLLPTVAVMNNGATKGGSPDVVRTLKALPSLEALYQGHRNTRSTPDDNTAPELIANLDAPPADNGHAITATIDPAARSFTVVNGRTGEARKFQVK